MSTDKVTRSREYVLLSTSDLREWALDSRKRNRSVDDQWVARYADPKGWHVAHRIIMHNEVEWRCRIVMKVKGSMTGHLGWIDVGFPTWEKQTKRTDEYAAALETEEAFEWAENRAANTVKETP